VEVRIRVVDPDGSKTIMGDFLGQIDISYKTHLNVPVSPFPLYLLTQTKRITKLTKV
jgi:hypothetical protein